MGMPSNIDPMFVLLALLFLVAASPLLADDRVALVIGNSNYQHLNPLTNPRNDAAAVAERLAGFGFKLMGKSGDWGREAVYDLNEYELVDVLEKFGAAASQSEIALIYYAGHGVQIDADSHILPVDIRSPGGSLTQLRRNSVSLTYALNALRGEPRLSVIIFDACREIPDLAKTMRGGTLSALASPERGLGRTDVEGGDTGALVAYAGSSGQLVNDGMGTQHSPYTTVFLEHVGDRNLDVRNLLDEVRNEFHRRYQMQAPEVLAKGYIERDRFCLAGPCIGVPPNPSGGGETTPEMRAMMDFTAASVADSCKGWLSFIESHPRSHLASLARDKAEGLGCYKPAQDPDDERWDRARAHDRCEDYLAYYRAFPAGKHVADARGKLEGCVEDEKRRRALAFVDEYYGALGHASCARIESMWVRPPVKLCELSDSVSAFRVLDKKVVSLERRDAQLAIEVRGSNYGESENTWKGCLDLAWDGEDWRLVGQHSDQSGPCRGVSTPSPPRAPTPSQSDRDVEAVLAFAQQYYDTLSTADCNAVASLWDPATLPSKLCRSVVDVEWFRVERKEIEQLSGDYARVAVDVTGKAKRKRPESWRMSLLLLRQYGTWKLSKMSTR